MSAMGCPPMIGLTGFQRDILYIVAGLGGPHGSAIRDELEDYYRKDITSGRLYPNLDTLVDKGLVEKDQYDKRTNCYALTDHGRRELDVRRDWESQYMTE